MRALIHPVCQAMACLLVAAGCRAARSSRMRTRSAELDGLELTSLLNEQVARRPSSAFTLASDIELTRVAVMVEF